MFASLMFFGHLLVVLIAIGVGLPPFYVHLAGSISLLVFPLGMMYLGYLMAEKRVELMDMKKQGAPAAHGTELATSVLCFPCAAGQEVEFMEKYKETFRDSEW